MRIKASEDLKSFLREIEAKGVDPGAALSAIFEEWMKAKKVEHIAEELRDSVQELKEKIG